MNTLTEPRDYAAQLETLEEDEEAIASNAIDFLNGMVTIDAGIGEIHWHSYNLQLQQLMEALGEVLNTTSPLELERRIRG
jgi:hypothetical protein